MRVAHTAWTPAISLSRDTPAFFFLLRLCALHTAQPKRLSRSRSIRRQKELYLVMTQKLEQRTPLFEAVEMLDPQSVSRIIEMGENVDVCDRYGITPLHAAVASHRFENMKPLIDAGADVNAQNIAGSTPLHLAAGVSLDAVKSLLEAGANVNATDKLERTPLHIAAEKSLDVVTILIDAGADKTRCDKRGFTPADIARKNAAGNIQCGAIYKYLNT